MGVFGTQFSATTYRDKMVDLVRLLGGLNELLCVVVYSSACSTAGGCICRGCPSLGRASPVLAPLPGEDVGPQTEAAETVGSPVSVSISFITHVMGRAVGVKLE